MEKVGLVGALEVHFSVSMQNGFHTTSPVHLKGLKYLDAFQKLRIPVSVLSQLIFSIHYVLLNLLGRDAAILPGLVQHSNSKWQIWRISVDFREQ